jgi:hypothetical protein
MKTFLAPTRLPAVASLSFPHVRVVTHEHDHPGSEDLEKDHHNPERSVGVTTR